MWCFQVYVKVILPYRTVWKNPEACACLRVMCDRDWMAGHLGNYWLLLNDVNLLSVLGEIWKKLDPYVKLYIKISCGLRKLPKGKL